MRLGKAGACCLQSAKGIHLGWAGRTDLPLLTVPAGDGIHGGTRECACRDHGNGTYSAGELQRKPFVELFNKTDEDVSYEERTTK